MIQVIKKGDDNKLMATWRKIQAITYNNLCTSLHMSVVEKT